MFKEGALQFGDLERRSVVWGFRSFVGEGALQFGELERRSFVGGFRSFVGEGALQFGDFDLRSFVGARFGSKRFGEREHDRRLLGLGFFQFGESAVGIGEKGSRRHEEGSPRVADESRLFLEGSRKL